VSSLEAVSLTVDYIDTLLEIAYIWELGRSRCSFRVRGGLRGWRTILSIDEAVSECLDIFGQRVLCLQNLGKASIQSWIDIRDGEQDSCEILYASV